MLTALQIRDTSTKYEKFDDHDRPFDPIYPVADDPLPGSRHSWSRTVAGIISFKARKIGGTYLIGQSRPNSGEFSCTIYDLVPYLCRSLVSGVVLSVGVEKEFLKVGSLKKDMVFVCKIIGITLQ